MNANQTRNFRQLQNAALTASVVNVDALTPATRQDMFALMQRYYGGIDAQIFAEDLNVKDVAVLLHDEAGRLAGLSTAAVWFDECGGQRFQVLFSGDTIIDQRHWGSTVFPTQWLKFAALIKARSPEIPLYWFLIVKGHRTYRYLSVFARSYYPSPDAVAPHDLRQLADHLARRKFGAHYDAARGLLRFPQSRGHLLPAWAAIPEKDLGRREVSYFLSLNPGYARGEELVCLAEIAAGNMKPFARRIFESAAT